MERGTSETSALAGPIRRSDNPHTLQFSVYDLDAGLIPVVARFPEAWLQPRLRPDRHATSTPNPHNPIAWHPLVDRPKELRIEQAKGLIVSYEPRLALPEVVLERETTS